MTVDINTLSYTELLDLQKQVAASVESRKPEEEAEAKKAWLASDCAKAALKQINALRKQYDKIAAKCGKSKSIVLKVKMTVDIDPRDFDDLLDYRWECGFGDVFTVECSGDLTNKGDCGDLGYEIQEQIDSVMADVCEDAVGIHGSLKGECDDFVEELNALTGEIREVESMGITLGDIVKADAAAQKKAAKKKAAKKGK